MGTNEELNEELKPCPACRSDAIVVYESHRGGYYVQCENCEMRGPRKDDERVALDAWNGLSSSLSWTGKRPPSLDGIEGALQEKTCRTCMETKLADGPFCTQFGGTMEVSETYSCSRWYSRNVECRDDR